MENKLKLILTAKLLELCDLPKDAAVYAILLEANTNNDLFSKAYWDSLNNIPNLLSSTLEVFCNKKTNLAKGSYEFSVILQNKDRLIDLISKNKGLLGLNNLKIADDKTEASLAILFGIYLESFIRPIQFFLPVSSACSGQWKFWEEINYFDFLRSNGHKINFIEFMEKLEDKNLWNLTFKPADFPEIVKKRLEKENAFGKKLDSNAMIKAIIIRIGELAQPAINYEAIDYSIRNFFTYLGTKQYLRIDREIAFLRRFEKEMMKTLGSLEN